MIFRRKPSGPLNVRGYSPRSGAYEAKHRDLLGHGRSVPLRNEGDYR
jgi:hypothetical protein